MTSLEMVRVESEGDLKERRARESNAKYQCWLCGEPHYGTPPAVCVECGHRVLKARESPIVRLHIGR